MTIFNDRIQRVLRNTGGLFLLMLLFSCASSSEETNTAKSPQATASPDTLSQSYETGKVITVQVRAHPTESYTLYVPLNYKKEDKHPVIFFFDAHGNGKLPVEKYKALGEKFGIILAGSNNSKNGLPYENILPFAQHMMQQVKNDLSIDEKSIFTGGFSGGARVAANIAFTETSVKGVIGCSAGFDPQNDSLPIVFAGITADEDMNYLEMKLLERVLDKNKGEHVLLVGKGKHEWPDTTLMKDAFRFMIFRTQMKDTKPEIINDFILSYSWHMPSDKLAIYQLNKFMYRSLNGITDNFSYEKNYKHLEKDATVIEWLEQERKNEEKELKMQKYYSDALITKDLSWWKSEIKKLNTERTIINKRVLNYLSLQTYMMVNQAFAKENRDAIEHFLTVYSLVDPSNSEWAYLRARYESALGNYGSALSYFERAIELGFKDVKRAEAEPAFNSIKQDGRYSSAIRKIQQ